VEQETPSAMICCYGLLPCDRALRVHRADLAKLLVPTADLSVPPLTEAEVKAALVALKEAQALTAAIQHQHGKPLSASWPLIRQAREKHATDASLP